MSKHTSRYPRLLPTEPTLPARSSIQDAYSSSGVHMIISDNGHADDDAPPPPPSRLRRHVSLKNILHSTENEGSVSSSSGIVSGNATSASSSSTPVAMPDSSECSAESPASGTGSGLIKMASFANLNKSSDKGINLTYQESKESSRQSSRVEPLMNKISKKPPAAPSEHNNGYIEKKATFATLPNMTSWQEQRQQHPVPMERQSTGIYLSNYDWFIKDWCTYVICFRWE